MKPRNSSGLVALVGAVVAVATVGVLAVRLALAEPRAYERPGLSALPDGGPPPAAGPEGQDGGAVEHAPADAGAPAVAASHIPSEASLPAMGPRIDGTNYFAFNVHDFRAHCAGATPCEGGLAQFRIDLAYDIIRLERWRDVGYFYLTTPIRFLSFWDLLDKVDGSRSSPFIETNYAPGVEVSYVFPHESLLTSRGSTGINQRHMLTFGLLHESNGLGKVLAQSNDSTQYSRSWNRFYLTGRLAIIDGPHLQLSTSPTVWLPFADEPIDEKGWPDGSLARTRIRDYMGYGELVTILQVQASRWIGFRFRVVLRQHSLDGEARWSLKHAQVRDGATTRGNAFRLDLLFHCFWGRGERLMVANEFHDSCYAGVGL